MGCVQERDVADVTVHRSFPKPEKSPVHFNFKAIEYRLASQINARDTLFWSLSFRGVDSDSAEVGSMTNKLALAAQNAAKHLMYSQSVVEIRVLLSAWWRELREDD